jgi:beta-glucanase (GH16 family)
MTRKSPVHGRSARALAKLTAGVAVVTLIVAGAIVKESSASPALAATATATTVKPPAGWKLTFNVGSFAGKQLNTKLWSTCYWWVKPGKGCANNGNASQDKEWYQPSQDQVSGGVLHLVAQHKVTEGTNAKGQPEKFYCRSGMVTTNSSFNFEYGFVQLRVRVPYGKGLWPALWLAASNHKWPPEIDMLEHWASQSNAGVYLHPVTGPRQGGRVSLTSNLSKGWHTISLYWTKSRLTWYIDNRQVLTTTKGIPKQKMYLIMNLADTSTAAGTCTGTMLVSSVRVWQPTA